MLNKLPTILLLLSVNCVHRHTANRMHLLSAPSLLLAAAGLFSAVSAHNIQLPAHGRECFHEQLHKDDKMTVSFQVGDREFGSAGNLEIDFWVRIRLARVSTSKQEHADHESKQTDHKSNGRVRGLRKVRLQWRPFLRRQARRKVHLLLRQ